MNNVELVRHLYDAFAGGDVGTVLEALDEGVEWTEADGFPHGGTYVGLKAVIDGVFARIGSDWDPFVADMTEFLDAGEHVVAIGRYRGKLRATDTPFDAEAAVVWTLRDGKVVRFRQYVDTASLRPALAA
ncbi:MAG: nuclear transport factor 2 family protein [Thermoleophilaceae bacterium]|nr:nuclear transport factor 2 family protein [Thermoleophilaceae bacterium]